MFRVFQLGLVALLLAACFARPLGSSGPRPSKEHRYDLLLSVDHTRGAFGGFLSDDPGVRSERSTNLSHITGTARKIQMYVKNRHLQILPDGTVNGTNDDVTVCDGCIDYTILQRSSVNNGQLKIQGVATCLFLCMDSCGLLYGSREFIEDCIFNESIEQHYYNTYSSAKYSNNKRSLYLALNKRGQPRKVQVKAHAPLGKLSTYTKVLTRNVPAEKVERMVENILRLRQIEHQHATSSGNIETAQHHIRHHGYHQLCPSVPVKESKDTDDVGRDKSRCRRRKKRKKKKRKCREGEEEGEQCQSKVKNKKLKRKCEEVENTEECLKRLIANRKRRKKKKLNSMITSKKKKKNKEFAKFTNESVHQIGAEDLISIPTDFTTPANQRLEEWYDTTPVTLDDFTMTFTSFNEERTEWTEVDYDESSTMTVTETNE